jgi:hypothetical protein
MSLRLTPCSIVAAYGVGRVLTSTTPAPSQPGTRRSTLDAQLPLGGWPDAALTEILSARPGLGELTLVWPTLAGLTAAGERVVLIAPPTCSIRMRGCRLASISAG